MSKVFTEYTRTKRISFSVCVCIDETTRNINTGDIFEFHLIIRLIIYDYCNYNSEKYLL